MEITPPRTPYSRATAVVIDPTTRRVLLVKHNRENQWSLPGGRIMGAEDPAHRVVVEVAEETGIMIDEPVFAGRYAGSVASHQIYVATGDGHPRINTREIQDATWWDPETPLRTQQHVSAILALVRRELRQKRTEREDPVIEAVEHLPVPITRE